MTAPNLASPTSITGKVATASLTTTNATSVLSNAASSNKCLRVVSLIVSNVDGANACDITINYYSAASLGGTATQIVNTVSVPADASLVVIDRSTALYLEEDRSLGATAAVASDLKVVCVYEEIA